MNVIFCATKFEIFGFLRKLKILKKSIVKNSGFYSCLFENRKKVIIVITGIGRNAVEIACRHFLAQVVAEDVGDSNNAGRNKGINTDNIFNNDMSSLPNSNAYNMEHNIIITGFGGSLTDDLKVGDLVLVNEIVNLEKKYMDDDGFCFVVSGRIKIKNSIFKKMFLKKTEIDTIFNDRSDRIIYSEACCATLDEVINSNNQKEAVVLASGASILDMETYLIVKNLNNLENKSFLCLRTISDDNESNLPDFVKFFSNRGFLSGSKFFSGNYFISYLKGFFKCFAFLLIKPANIRSLLRFLKNISLAEKTLSMAIEKLIKNSI